MRRTKRTDFGTLSVGPLNFTHLQLKSYRLPNNIQGNRYQEKLNNAIDASSTEYRFHQDFRNQALEDCSEGKESKLSINSRGIGFRQFTLIRHTHIQVTKQTVVDSINPTVHAQLLPMTPGILHNRCPTHIQHLLDDI